MIDSDKSDSLAGRWALVTGAGRRIGAAIAESLHAAGANVVVHYRQSGEAAQALVGTLNSSRPDSALAMQQMSRTSLNRLCTVITFQCLATQAYIRINRSEFDCRTTGIRQHCWF